MTAPVLGTWRVATDAEHTPAHYVARTDGETRVTGCDWTLPEHGHLVTWGDVITRRCFVCRRCRKAAKR